MSNNFNEGAFNAMLPADAEQPSQESETVEAAPTPPPAAPKAEVKKAEPVAQDAEKSPADEDIRDEAAYHKAQAEKFERLFKKAQQQLEQVAEAEQAKTDEAKTLEERLAQLEQEAAEAKRQAEQSKLTEIRLKAVTEAGLPTEAAQFITAKTEDSIAEQVQALRAIAPQARRGPVGNNAETSSINDPIMKAMQERSKGFDTSAFSVFGEKNEL